MSATAEAYILFLFFIIVMFLLYGFFQKKLKLQEDMFNNHNFSGFSVLVQNRLRRSYGCHYAQQQEQNVYSISGRVQGQEQQQRFPEAFVSVEHISIMNEMNKPPKYDDAPPSYEEAIKIAMAQNNSMETLRAEQAGVHQASSSSSVTVVQPAVPNRTTE
ncbi:uncharacterized protein LOC115884078 isoform X3 [Sitophilus oryzae]|uniref:Uncharacterized protein LOC115884078 isoform X3 n=1 Tax=Sitophilus oryzae TaxID=7048 RepID=A0A6J2Y3Y7_SITOR|nr:uncharacterized protein LOC115884078 isoform X3 [Sitophilus oryzae]